MTREDELAARIAARRLKDRAAWQARYDALPAVTIKTCHWCGDYADEMSRDYERIAWCCKRCRTEVVVEVTGLTYAEAAAHVGVSIGWIKQAVAGGSLQVKRHRYHDPRIDPRALEAWIEERGRGRRKA